MQFTDPSLSRQTAVTGLIYLSLLAGIVLQASPSRASNIYVITLSGSNQIDDETPLDATAGYSRSQWIQTPAQLGAIPAGSVIFGIGLYGRISVQDEMQSSYVYFDNTTQNSFAGTSWAPLGTSIWQGTWGHPAPDWGWWGESTSGDGWALQNTGNDFFYKGGNLLVTVGSDDGTSEADSQLYVHHTDGVNPNALLRYRSAVTPPGSTGNEGPLTAVPSMRVMVHFPAEISAGPTPVIDFLPAGVEHVNMYIFTQLSSETVTIETAPGTPGGDTRIWLLDPQGTVIDFDDDSGTGFYSRISTASPLAPGTYFVKVEEYDRDVDIDYSLTLGGPDDDSDGWPDSVDNCPLDDNVDQADADGDGVGDVCDNCPETRNPGQLDQGGIGSTSPDGVGDLCQNADFNGDGTVDILDVTLVRRALAGLEPTLDPAMPPSD